MRASFNRRAAGSAVVAFLVAASLVLVLIPVGAASVTPILIEQTSSLKCAELAPVYGFDGTSTVKFDPPHNGTKTGAAGLTVTVSNFDGKSFNWSSNQGIDAVYVKAGRAGSYLYVYEPNESFGDTGLTTPGEKGNAISHITFCYDGDPTTTTTTTLQDVSVSVTPGACVWDGEESLTPVVVTIDPDSGATVTLEGPGGPWSFSGSGGSVEVGPGSYSWSAVAAEGFELVEPSSGSFVAEDCAPSPFGEIGDLVWFDNNGDGLQNAGESGVAGVSVLLLDGGGALLDSTVTDSGGHYLFDGLPAGSYIVEFAVVTLPDDYEVTDQDQGDDTLDSDADPATGRTATIELAQGQKDHTWDLGIYKLDVSPTTIPTTTVPSSTTTSVPPTSIVTLPKTGTGIADAGGLAAALLALGLMLVLAMRRRPEAVAVALRPNGVPVWDGDVLRWDD